MPQFEYKARGADGQVTHGSIEATDRRQALQRLQQDGLRPLTVAEAQTAKSKRANKWLKNIQTLQGGGKKTSAKEAVAESSRGGSPRRESAGLGLLKRLLELHSSGMPVGDSIRTLSQRLSQAEQKALAARLWRDLSEGATLAGAMARQPRYFAGSVCHVVEAGEATGHLAPILRKIVEHLEEKAAIRQKMLASMAYPAVICVVALVVVVLFLTVLLPRIQDMLSRLGGEMTWSARILIDGADFLMSYGPFLAVAAAIAGVSLSQWRRTDAGRRTTDRWALRLPLLGRIFQLSDLFQAGNLIGTLLESGINTTETLRLTERTIHNTELRERFNTARSQINEGLALAQAFKRNAFMPDLALDILAVGENTGHLGQSMEEVTRGFRNDLTRRLSQLTTLVSSGALLGAFVLVALIAIGIITSVMGLSQSLSQ
ncbi:MAG: type II secretion system F family protein [Coraliomargaritaceae bacterium]